MKIENLDKPFDIEVKRFNFPSKFTVTCKCGAEVTHDFRNEYLGYPTANRPSEVYMYCHACDQNWTEKIVVRVRIEATPEEVPDVENTQEVQA